MRTRKSQKRYMEHDNGLGAKECQFCDITHKEPRKVYEETTYFYRVENNFGYDIWDGHRVVEHQMIVPKRHFTTWSDMNDKEGKEYLQLITQAEKNGYCLYTRGINGPTKSVPHAHSHLIKLDPNHQIKQYVFIRKPHLVLFRSGRK